MQEIPSITRACKREFIFVAPHVIAHDEETNRGRPRIFILLSLQRIVEPLKRSSRHVEHRGFPEYYIAHFSFRRCRSVRPWANEQSLTSPCIRVAGFRFE